MTGRQYNQQLTVNGGATPYSFSVSTGTLPTGLTLSSTGKIDGSPTEEGIFNFSVKATYANGCPGIQNYTIIISRLYTFTNFDFDGDGKTDISIFRPSVGEWWYLRSGDGSSRAFQFGLSTDKPVQADYTGDGKTDVAFFRPSTGEWFVLRSENFSFYSAPFGTNGDIPAPGDYDGDGKADFAVWRGSDRNWYILRSSSGVLIQQFGAAGDKPVPSAFVP